MSELATFLYARIAERLKLAEHVVDGLVKLPHKPGTISFEGQDIYNPRQVLAECEAATALVVELDRMEREEMGWDDIEHKVMCYMALPYAGHEDYRPGWRPQPGPPHVWKAEVAQ